MSHNTEQRIARELEAVQQELARVTEQRDRFEKDFWNLHRQLSEARADTAAVKDQLWTVLRERQGQEV